MRVHHAAQHNDMWNARLAMLYANVNGRVSHEPFLRMEAAFCVSTLEKSW
jgi:hypothetical protein